MKVKQWQNIFHAIENANSIVQLAIHIKNAIAKHVNVNVKITVHTKRIIVGICIIWIIVAHVFVRIASIKNVFLILQWSRVMKLYLLWILYQQKRKTISTNMSINSDDKKVRYKIDCYILHSVWLVHINIDNYYYFLSLCKA